jgi:hypothetical protein
VTVTPTPTPGGTPGGCSDFDGDGVVSVRDVRELVRHLGKKRFDPRYDLNGDGRITGRDVVLAIRQLGQSCDAPSGARRGPKVR